jgi:hypothetical protein
LRRDHQRGFGSGIAGIPITSEDAGACAASASVVIGPAMAGGCACSANGSASGKVGRIEGSSTGANGASGAGTSSACTLSTGMSGNASTTTPPHFGQAPGGFPVRGSMPTRK